MKSHNPTLIEAVKTGFKACFETAWTRDYMSDGPEDDEVDPKAELDRYMEPLDIIYADYKKLFGVFSDDGDLLNEFTDINDAFNYIKKTGNKIGLSPTKSYGNRWLNHGDPATTEDLIHIMDKNNGRKPFGLLNVSDEEIQSRRANMR